MTVRTTLLHVVHAIEADEFGILGITTAQNLIDSPNKRERKATFRRLVKLYKIAYPGSIDSVEHVSVGTDSLGTLILYFHLRRLA